MKKTMLTATVLSVLAISGCGTQTSKEVNADSVEKTESAIHKNDAEKSVNETPGTTVVKGEGGEGHKTSEEENIEKFDVPRDVEKQRAKAIKGKALYEILDNDTIAMLGIAIGDSFENVQQKWGKPDLKTGIIENGVNYDTYFYYMPAKSLSNDLIGYKVIIRTEDNAEFADSIGQIKVTVYEKPNQTPNIHLPKGFLNKFNGDIVRDHNSIYKDSYYNIYFFYDPGTIQQSQLTVNTQVLNHLEVSTKVMTPGEKSVVMDRDVLKYDKSQIESVIEKTQKAIDEDYKKN
ncbi:hypothetical protein C1N61_32655 (plasmid) [Priestia aryabhattai]